MPREPRRVLPRARRGQGERLLALQLAGETEQLPAVGVWRAQRRGPADLPLAQAEAAPKGGLSSRWCWTALPRRPATRAACRDRGAVPRRARRCSWGATMCPSRRTARRRCSPAWACPSPSPAPRRGRCAAAGRASITLRFATAASWYRLVIEDCSAAMGSPAARTSRRSSAAPPPSKRWGRCCPRRVQLRSAGGVGAQEGEGRAKRTAIVGLQGGRRCCRMRRHGRSPPRRRHPGDAGRRGGEGRCSWRAGLSRLRQIAAQVVNEPAHVRTGMSGPHRHESSARCGAGRAAGPTGAGHPRHRRHGRAAARSRPAWLSSTDRRCTVARWGQAAGPRARAAAVVR